MDEGKLKKLIWALKAIRGFKHLCDKNDVDEIIGEAKKDFLCRVYYLKPEQIDEEFMDALRLQIDSLKEIKVETGLPVNSEWLLWFFDWFIGDKKK